MQIIKSHLTGISLWLKDFWYLAKPYWVSEQKSKAILMLSVVIGFNLATVYMAVVFNKWNNLFYNSLQDYNKAVFFKLIIKFCYIAFFSILFSVISYYIRKMLEISWRKWLTAYYINSWLSNQAFYKTRFVKSQVDNPDQRVSEDINSFIVISLDLTLGFISSLVSLFSFVFILWQLSGALNFIVFGKHWTINGYMVWSVLIYAIVGTYLTFKIGKPLVKLDFRQQAYEADFRYGLLRVREYSENIAFYQSENQEKAALISRFNYLVNNFIEVIKRNLKISIVNIGYNQIAKIFPILVVAPRYFAKKIELGGVIQIASAFERVQDALSFFLNAYTSLAGWRAIMDRLKGFQQNIYEANKFQTIPQYLAKQSYLTAKDITIDLPNKANLITNLDFSLSAGDRVLITGKSGSGKTTLLRVLAGLWPFAEGSLSIGENKTSIFVAQRPYVPLTSLTKAVCYPLNEDILSRSQLIEHLQKCELAKFTDKLDEVADWSKILSLGEQQKLAFCRVLVNRPDLIYLDEATSALDEESEEYFYQLLINELPNSALVSIGHRSTIKKWHNLFINFNQFRVLNGQN